MALCFIRAPRLKRLPSITHGIGVSGVTSAPTRCPRVAFLFRSAPLRLRVESVPLGFACVSLRVWEGTFDRSWECSLRALPNLCGRTPGRRGCPTYAIAYLWFSLCLPGSVVKSPSTEFASLKALLLRMRQLRVAEGYLRPPCSPRVAFPFRSAPLRLRVESVPLCFACVSLRVWEGTFDRSWECSLRALPNLCGRTTGRRGRPTYAIAYLWFSLRLRGSVVKFPVTEFATP